jgi:hypothetical protein
MLLLVTLLRNSKSKSGKREQPSPWDIPYEAGIKFMLQPQNNARINSRFSAHLFLSRSGYRGVQAASGRRSG